MTADLKTAKSSGDTEPTSAFTTMPLWLVVMTMLVLFWGTISFDQHGAWFEPRVYEPYESVADLQRFQPRSGGQSVLLRGKTLFDSNCALCHGTDGLGKPNQAPPLAGSEWVLAKGVNRLVRIPSVGLSGPVEVKGQQFNLSMAAMGAAYSHEDLAAVLSYIRNSWGNKASIVTPDQVKKVRADLAGRTQPYSPDELKTLPEE